MSCPLCEKFRVDHPLEHDEDGFRHVLGEGISSDPIQCAFEHSEVFSTDNWCCETMAHLRRLFDWEKMSPIWHNDSNIGVLPIPLTEKDDGVQQGMVVLAWYKNRGRTGQAMVFRDDDTPEPLTLKTALHIINQMNLKGE